MRTAVGVAAAQQLYLATRRSPTQGAPAKKYFHPPDCHHKTSPEPAYSAGKSVSEAPLPSPQIRLVWPLLPVMQLPCSAGCVTAEADGKHAAGHCCGSGTRHDPHRSHPAPLCLQGGKLQSKQQTRPKMKAWEWKTSPGPPRYLVPVLLVACPWRRGDGEQKSSRAAGGSAQGQPGASHISQAAALDSCTFLRNHYTAAPVDAFPCYKRSALNLGHLAYQICRRVENSFPAERVIHQHAERVWVCIACSGTGHIQVLIPEECTPCSICL